MNRLFKTLRSFTDKSRSTASADQQSHSISEALPGFFNRIVVLSKYAERASAYEDELVNSYAQIMDHMNQLQDLMEQAIDDGRDLDALEYLRLAARLRPQLDLLDRELQAFHAVAADLLERFSTLMANVEEARDYARSDEYNP